MRVRHWRACASIDERDTTCYARQNKVLGPGRAPISAADDSH
jgi:hypothetical protein